MLPPGIMRVAPARASLPAGGSNTLMLLQALSSALRAAPAAEPLAEPSFPCPLDPLAGDGTDARALVLASVPAVSGLHWARAAERASALQSVKLRSTFMLRKIWQHGKRVTLMAAASAAFALDMSTGASKKTTPARFKSKVSCLVH